eukprot:s85_g22.t1
MVAQRLGIDLMDQLEKNAQVTAARSAIVKAIIQQPDLLKSLPSLDPETLLNLVLQQEFPDLPDSVRHRVVPKMTELKGELLPWNRRMRRRILKAPRVILHLFSGKDQKTWRQLEDSNTVVLCVDRLINPKLDVMDDQVMLFLLKIAASGSLHAILGGPPCRSVSACRYSDDQGPKPVRSEMEPYGLSTLSFQQREWVEMDIAMMFRMKLLFLVAEESRPTWRKRTLFIMEQPQDPKEYRSPEDVSKHGYMSVWRTEAWRCFQDRYNMMLTSFEQGAFGHAKPKPTTLGHNLDGLHQLHGATVDRSALGPQLWKDKPLPERLEESATWAAWAPGLKEALLEGLRRNLQPLPEGRHHLGAPGSAEEASRDSECDDTKPSHGLPQMRPLSEVALARWKAHVLNDHQPMKRDCKVCVEAAGISRQHRRITHPSAYCLSVDLSGKLVRGTDQFGKHSSYFMVGCFTFPTTADGEPLCGPGKKPIVEDAPLPSLDEGLDEDGLCGDFEDYELPRIESDDEVPDDEGDPAAISAAQKSYDSWMKLVEDCRGVKVRTLTFVENLASRATADVMDAVAKIYSQVRFSFSIEVPALLPFNTKVYVKRKSWNERYAAWRWERSVGYIKGPDPWSSLTSGGYCVQLENGTYLASSDVIVEHVDRGEDELHELVVQERAQQADREHFDEVPRRRMRRKQALPQLAKLELDANSGEKGLNVEEESAEVSAEVNKVNRLLQLHQNVSKVLSEECVFVDDMDPDHAACIPTQV